MSHEFLEREDGWPGLSRAYGLAGAVTGIEHGLAYQALDDGALDVTDAYSTDGELQRYGLTILEDDRGFFPQYLAAPLVRDDAPDPEIARVLILGTADPRVASDVAGAATPRHDSEVQAAVVHG